MRTTVKFAIALTFACCIALSSADADPASSPEKVVEATPEAPTPEPTPLPDDATLLKMKVRQLKQMLLKKGADAECKACTSKGEYVDRIRETADWPDVTLDAAPSDEKMPSVEELQKMFANKDDTKYMEELKAKLKASGIDSSNLFAATGGLNPDQFAKGFKEMNMGGKASNEEPSEEINVDAAADDVKPEL